MQKSIAILLLMALLLSPCASGKETEVPSALEFQGVPWNSSPEEVFEMLGVDQKTLTWGETQTNRLSENFMVTASDWKVFGETAVSVAFFFENHIPGENDYFGLAQAQVFYPENGDKEEVLSGLRKSYGREAETYTLYSVMSGEPKPITYIKEPGKACWFSLQLMGEILTERGEQEYRDVLKQNLGEVSDELFQACLDAPTASVRWVEDYYGQFEQNMEEAIAQNGRLSWLEIGADTMVGMIQRFDTVS